MIVGGQKILVQVGNANRASLANKTGWEERQLGGLAGGLSRKYKFVKSCPTSFHESMRTSKPVEGDTAAKW